MPDPLPVTRPNSLHITKIYYSLPALIYHSVLITVPNVICCLLSNLMHYIITVLSIIIKMNTSCYPRPLSTIYHKPIPTYIPCDHFYRTVSSVMCCVGWVVWTLCLLLTVGHDWLAYTSLHFKMMRTVPNLYVT